MREKLYADGGEVKSLQHTRVETDLLQRENHHVEESSWRVFRIMSEFVAGFDLLKRYGLAVTFFGSARTKEASELYIQTRHLAERLSEDGYTVITGGGHGVMGAANHGARDAGGPSVGLNIEIPEEQTVNQHVTDSQKFHYFFVRKVMLAFASEVYIFMPGGFGTMDEFFEIVTLVQTKKIRPIPIILIGRSYWEPLLRWIEQELYEKHHYIDEEDMKLYHLVDTVTEAYELITRLMKSERQ